MNKAELREQALKRFDAWRSAYADLLLYGKPMPVEQDNVIDETITLIRTATLAEVSKAIEHVLEVECVDVGSGDTILSVIDNLRGTDEHKET